MGRLFEREVDPCELSLPFVAAEGTRRTARRNTSMAVKRSPKKEAQNTRSEFRVPAVRWSSGQRTGFVSEEGQWKEQAPVGMVTARHHRYTPRTMNAQTLQCHSCGAAVAGADPNCGHCGARLQTRSCPSCFGMMFSDSRYCPQCGASAVSWEADESKFKCPGCKDRLHQGTLGATRLHECPKCLGVWLDPATLERLARDADQQAVILSGAPTAGVTATSTVFAPVCYRPCVLCQEPMTRVNYARCSGVIVDVCRAHGTWFDVDELQRTVRFIQGGGLQWARAREHADLASERRLLEAARTASLIEPMSSGTSETQVVEAVVQVGTFILWEWLTG